MTGCSRKNVVFSIFILLLIVIKTLAKNLSTADHRITPENTTQPIPKPGPLKENFPVSEFNETLVEGMSQTDFYMAESELVRIVLKGNHLRGIDEITKNSTKYLINSTVKALENLNASEVLNLADGEVAQMVTTNREDIGKIAQNITQALAEVENKSGIQALINLSTSENLDQSSFVHILANDVTNLPISQEKRTDLDSVTNLNLAKGQLAREEGKHMENNSISADVVNSTALPVSNVTEKFLIEIVLKDASKFQFIAHASTESAIKVESTTSVENEITIRPSVDSKNNKNSDLTEKNFINTVMQLAQQQEIEEVSTENISSTTSVEEESITKPSSNLEIYRNTNQAEATTSEENSTEYLNETVSSKFESKGPNTLESTLKSISVESQVLQTTLHTTIEQEHIKDSVEISSQHLEDTTTTPNEMTTKPAICLEKYAVKQMNFILDHLLMETQEFVAKVLQATVNSVFPRDQLKLYAEGLNRVLNPDVYSDYTDESTEDERASTQDELYENIVEKLNFMKSKPSKFLQKHLPPDWINDYRNKRAEQATWLDKATDQMHNEFNRYITEEDDYIKYKYFNETFDDISRATEIHHKLALLADLVKIVKNKKQITFMDLYMAT